MDVLSPYGKSVSRELKTVYGLDGPHAARDFVSDHLARSYGLGNVSVETLIVAFGLTAMIEAGGKRFVLKFASRSMHPNPEQLFPWIEHARDQGVAVPEVMRTNDGDWFSSPLGESVYDIVYLMRHVPGAPLATPLEPELNRYAETMARFHEVGQAYPHPVDGKRATWNDRFGRRDALWKQADESPLLSSTLLTEARTAVESIGECKLSSTTIHGDFRFCHVFFEEGAVSGLIDIDLSGSGECWLDLCAGLLSGNSPESGNFLNFEELRQTLASYHQHRPLGSQEQAALKANFAYAGVETLWDVAHFVTAGVTPKHDIESLEDLLNQILMSSDLLS